jgi:hypothetical protein
MVSPHVLQEHDATVNGNMHLLLEITRLLCQSLLRPMAAMRCPQGEHQAVQLLKAGVVVSMNLLALLIDMDSVSEMG